MSTQGRYSKIDKLGEGTYGSVYKAQSISTGKIVALKRMNIPPEEDGIPATTLREVCILREMRHENIVELQDILFQMPKLTLVFEFVDYDLKKYMDLKGSSLDPEREVKHFLHQMLCGLQYMHIRSIVHRDIKPQNILISKELNVKLADFGLARIDGIPVKKYSHEAVTLWYRSPDVILGSVNYGCSVDVWSLGCIFAEMILGVPLFNGKSDADQLIKIFTHLGYPTSSSWPSMHVYPKSKALLEEKMASMNAKCLQENLYARQELAVLGAHGLELLKRMLCFEPSQRISVSEALNHPYFHNHSRETIHSLHSRKAKPR
ncbi:cell division protein kinase 2 [Perkinsela sp. CCAP 1560/4]|nr:cell division protein kinase 2 [Perkinsela sp. CCAP 1560/4]|eukprot:KNH04212.1 cell division protein kinase 2 [Perkinsela sp. CCAP 1560/4]